MDKPSVERWVNKALKTWILVTLIKQRPNTDVTEIIRREKIEDIKWLDTKWSE